MSRNARIPPADGGGQAGATPLPARRPLRIAVFQHHPAEGPGRIAAWARERGHLLDVRMTAAMAQPAIPPGCDLLIVLGGPQSVNDPPPWLAEECRLVAAAVSNGMPVLGICLGAQVLATALGGGVARLPRPETGWTPVSLADGRLLEVLQWHEELILPPPGAHILAASEACPVQAFRVGRCAGLQFHPEWDAASVAALNAAFGAGSPLPRDAGAAEEEAHRQVDAWLRAFLDGWVERAYPGRT